MLQELVKPLQLLETATVFLSKEANVSCSCVYPIIHGLITNLACDQAFQGDSGGSIKTTLVFDSIDLMSSPAFLSVLDPCFKASDPEKESMKAHLVQLASEQDLDETEEEKNECVPPATKKKKTALDLLLDPEEAQCEEEQGAAVEEVTQYFAEKPVARETKLLVWWKMNCYRFSRLAKLARIKLCISATSTPSKRLFS